MGDLTQLTTVRGKGVDKMDPRNKTRKKDRIADELCGIGGAQWLEFNKQEVTGLIPTTACLSVLVLEQLTEP